KKARICIEATGVYHLQMSIATHRAKIEVMVVNPRVAKDFAGALSNRSKTDKVDAATLLEYVRRMEFEPWEPPRREVLELRGLGRRSAVQLLTELSVLDPEMTVRQIVAHAGLDPRRYESGTSVDKPVRISKVGNARIRAILFMIALSAIHHDHNARRFYAALL